MARRYVFVILTPIVIVLAIIVSYNNSASAPTKSTVTSKPNTSTHSTDQSTKPVVFNKQLYSTTDPTSLWVVINKQHPLQPLNYAPADLTSVGNGQFMRAEAAAALGNMFASAKTSGLTLTAASGYRSYQTQVATYNSEVKAYGQEKADSESARPGYSEHQSGWAVDIAGGGCYIEDCFANTPEGQWATANAYKFGFILRYTASDTELTGYRAEAWHFRYVGPALSEEMHKTDVATLEQFFGITGGSTYN